MITNPRASHPARRSGRLSDLKCSRPVTAYAAAIICTKAHNRLSKRRTRLLAAAGVR